MKTQITKAKAEIMGVPPDRNGFYFIPKLTQLRSPDLFTPEKQQVFSAKTGEYLGTVNEGEALPLTEKEKLIQQQEQADKNQLKLF